MTDPRRLWLHALALLVVVAIPSLAIGDRAVFHPDEGVVSLQVDVLDRTGEFGIEYDAPFDPEMEAVPLELASKNEADRTWFPYVKHPVHVAVLAALFSLFGSAGPLLLSCFGVTLAAAAAGVLAGRLRPSAAVPALWATGLSAPLFFSGSILIGHAIAAAGVGWLAVAALVAAERSATSVTSVAAWIGVPVLTTASFLVRTEAMFVAASVAIALMLLRRPLARRLGLLVLILAAVVVVREMESWLVTELAGTSSLAETEEAGAGVPGRTLARRADAAALTLLRPTFEGAGVPYLAAVGTIAVWSVALVRRRVGRFPIPILGAGAVCLLLASSSGSITPGFLVCMPLLAGLAGVERLDDATGELRTLVLAGALFAASVVATQADLGGGAYVGGRYFILALPLLVPPAIAGWAALIEGLDELRRPVLVLLSAVAALPALQATLASIDQRNFVADLVDSVRETRDGVAADDGAAPVLATSGWGSRYAWAEVAHGTWLTVGYEVLDRYSGRLADEGRPVVLLSGDPRRDEDELEGQWRIEWRSTFVAVLTPR